MPYDRAVVLRMLQLIPDDAENISLADERAAEQAAMAMDSLYIAYSKGAKPANAEEVRAIIPAARESFGVQRGPICFITAENPRASSIAKFCAGLR